MDPLSALSLAVAVAQFVDYGFKILGNAREIHGSLLGATQENQSLEKATLEMQRLTDKLVSSKLGGPTDEDKMLDGLVTECRSLSSQLLNLLNMIKARDPKSKTQIFSAALRAKRYEKEKIRLQRRLDECQLRLDRLLGALSRSEIKDQLKELVVSRNYSKSSLTSILSHVEELRRGAELTSIGPESRRQFQDLFGFTHHVQTRIAQRKILNLIAFPEMRNRVDTVPEAHKATFKWIFKDKDSASEDHMDQVDLFDKETREKVDKFVEWLSLGTGVYHISGKLGSGKSTLMKYLASHNRVREGLEKWAGGNKLVVASFFFWRWGTEHQRSLSGLLQTLLHDVLGQRPDLIPEVLPDLWLEASRSPGWDPTNFTLNRDNVRLAFSRLFQCATLYEDSNFCFFIDGMDEFEETLQGDHKELVQLLASWVQAAPHGVKLCVSSREYNVFLNFFPADKRLRLQDLTRGDMKRYVRERLQDLGQEDLDRIVRIIAEKSNGIFLWVALVVKSIRARLEDGFDASMIEEELNSLPEELEGLFRHLLNSISKLYRKQAYQTLAMVQLSQHKTFDYLPILTVGGYSFLDDYSVDPEFAQKPHFPFAALCETTRSQRESNARKRLIAHCRGLVETGSLSDLIHTHRSVVEFVGRHLQDTTTAKAMLAGFEPVHALSQLMLAELRSRPRDEYWTGPAYLATGHRPLTHHLLSIVVLGVMEARHVKRLDSPPYSFLEAFRLAANNAPPELYNIIWSQKQGPLVQRTLEEYWLLSSVVLNASAKLGLHQYFDWLTCVDPTAIDTTDKISGIVWVSVNLAVQGLPRWREDPGHNPFGVLGVLLRRGISPDATMSRDPLPNSSVPFESTLWEHLVVKLLASSPGPAIAKAGRVIQECLEHGANPSVRLALEDRRAGEKSVPGDVNAENIWTVDNWKRQIDGPNPGLSEFEGGVSRPSIKFKFENGLSNRVRCHVKQDSSKNALGYYTEEEIRFYTLFASKGGEISFEDFVEFLDFENKEAILELCARHKQTSATSKSTAPATDADEAADFGPADSTEEERNQESDAQPHGPQQLGSEVPLATAPEAQPHAPQQLGLDVPLDTALEAQLRDPQQLGSEVPLATAPETDLAVADGTVLSKLEEPTPSWRQRLRMNRMVDVTLAILVALVLSRLLPILGLHWVG